MFNTLPPFFYTILFGLLIGAGVLVPFFIVMFTRVLLKKKEKKHEAEAIIRFAAFLIDLVVIATLTNFIAGVRFYLKFGESGFLTDFYSYFELQIFTNMFYYMVSPLVTITGLYVFLYVDPSALHFIYLFTPYIINYSYFIVSDLIFKGNTFGRLAFRIKLRNVNGRPIKFYEILVNDLGKSFFFLADLIMGLILYSISKNSEGTSTKPNQIRLMQRVSGLIMVRVPKQVPAE